MSNKISAILSLIIFFQCFILCIDLINIQMVSSRLTVESNYLNSLIIKNKGINSEVLVYVDTIIQGELVCLNNCDALEYEKLIYRITVYYRSIYKNAINSMSITRSVLISYSL